MWPRRWCSALVHVYLGVPNLQRGFQVCPPSGVQLIHGKESAGPTCGQGGQVCVLTPVGPSTIVYPSSVEPGSKQNEA